MQESHAFKNNLRKAPQIPGFINNTAATVQSSLQQNTNAESTSLRSKSVSPADFLAAINFRTICLQRARQKSDQAETQPKQEEPSKDRESSPPATASVQDAKKDKRKKRTYTEFLSQLNLQEDSESLEQQELLTIR